MRAWFGWLTAVALHGCCTEAGCMGAVEVQVVGNAPEVFTIDVVSGDLRAHCDVDEAAGTVTCDGPLAEGSFEGGALELFVWINDDPETIHVTVADAGSAILFDDDVAPTYGDPFYPNGKRCGPECIGGTVDVDVP